MKIRLFFEKIKDIRMFIVLVNFVAVLFVNIVVLVTTNRVCESYKARDFLNTLNTIPGKPVYGLIWSLVLFGILMVSFYLRETVFENNIAFAYGSLIFDFLTSVVLIFVLGFNFNGILFMVFANVIAYAKENKGKYMIISIALISYLLTDAKLISLSYRIYDINDYFAYYNSSAQQYLVISLNLLISLNIMLFIIYCIFLIQRQQGTIEKINMLNSEIQKANADLKNANDQLEKYAKITEHMGETRERNRLAREIHDTLGHTLTGLSVGIDACIATVDVAPDATKKQLENLSEVARNGLLEIRKSVSELKPDAIERLNLDSAITKMITDMKSITDVEIYFDCKIDQLKFDEDEEMAIYRVIQESLTNAVRHGKAKKIWIVMDKADSSVKLEIKDNGVGCENIVSGFGTKHIAERIKMLGGSVEFSSNHGFCVRAEIPIRWGEEYD